MASKTKQPFWTRIVFPIATWLRIVIVFSKDQPDYRWVLQISKPRTGK